MNVRPCFILKYILLWQTLYQEMFIQKTYIQTTSIRVILNVIRTKP